MFEAQGDISSRTAAPSQASSMLPSSYDKNTSVTADGEQSRGTTCRHKRGHRGVVVGLLDFRSEGQWFEAQSLPLCCFLRQETLPHIVSLSS